MLGDEFHYLLECTYFTEERKKYLPKFYLRHVNILKFQKLMSTENLKLLKQLSRFIIPRQSRRDIVLASSVRPPVRPSIPSVRPSGTISQYLLVRFDSFLVQMISTMDSQTSNKFGQNQPLNT